MHQLLSNTSDSSVPSQVSMNCMTNINREMVASIHLNIVRKLISSNTPTRLTYLKIMSNKIPQVRLIKLILFIHLLIYFLITIINCCLINPGPYTPVEPKASSLNIFYQNIQGLIPFTELNKKHTK